MSNQSLFLLQWNVLLICNIFIFEDWTAFIFLSVSSALEPAPPASSIFPCKLCFSRALIIHIALLCSLMSVLSLPSMVPQARFAELCQYWEKWKNYYMYFIASIYICTAQYVVCFFWKSMQPPEYFCSVALYSFALQPVFLQWITLDQT